MNRPSGRSTVLTWVLTVDLAGLLLATGCRPAPAAFDPRPALEAAAQTILNEPGDAGAVMRLADGRLVLAHHWSVLAQRRMMAGSVIKLVTAYALAAAGHDPTFTCRGELNTQGTTRMCWFRPGHGALRLRAAIAHSCNVWFYSQSTRLTSDDWLRAARAFGVGRPLAEPGIARDLVPSTIASRDMPDVAVGDHVSLRVTPLSLLRAVSIIATSGRRVEPSRGARHPAPIADLDPDALRIVSEGMVAAVDDGTLARLFPPERVAAKTGTAKRYRATGTRGWVVGFVPRDRPEYAFVVVKDQGRGGPDAGPAAAELVEALVPPP